MMIPRISPYQHHSLLQHLVFPLSAQIGRNYRHRFTQPQQKINDAIADTA
jgi:hypothetical protein